MGKTSLLRWVQWSLLPDRPVIWLDPSRGLTPASMVQSIARALGKPEAAAVLDHPDATADRAGRVLDELVPFVLLVDDADALCSRGRNFDDSFFAAIRALVERGALTWVSASQRDLYEAFKARGLTSSFLLGTSKFEVGPLSHVAAHELMQRRLDAHTAAGLVNAAGGFAYGLQWLGDFVCRCPGALDEARDAFADDVMPTFQIWWAGIDARDRQLVKRCLSGDVTVASLDDKSRRRLRTLKKRGLLLEQDGRFIVEGDTWRSFVADAD
jgi:hypothetical protein